MPFGFLEIAILAVIVLILFGYKKLPQIGRSAGKGVNELKGSVGEMIGDRKVDPSSLGQSAGKGVREFREFKDALTGSADEERPRPSEAGKREPAPRAERPAAGADDAERVDGELVGPGSENGRST